MLKGLDDLPARQALFSGRNLHTNAMASPISVRANSRVQTAGVPPPEI
jgi:hypothetical protein